MKKLLLLIVCMLPVLSFAQNDFSTDSSDQNAAQILVTNGCVTLVPSSYDFGNQPVYFASNPKAFYLVNDCTVNLRLSNITAQGTAFTQTNHIGGTKTPCNVGIPITPGEFCEIDVVFDPHTVESFSNNLVIMYYKDNNPQLMQMSAGLSGTGIHDVTFKPASCDFGIVPIDSAAYCTVTITNQEPQELTIDRCHVSPDPPFSQQTSCPMSLKQNGKKDDSVDITLEFSPGAKGLFTGQFAVTTDSPEPNPYIVPLTGFGIPVCQPPLCCNGSGPGCPPSN